MNEEDDNRGYRVVGFGCIYMFCCAILCAAAFLISQCKWINP
jgi:hypothetical protein